MKKLLLILLCLPFIGFGQNVYIPDANFKAYLVGNTAINTNGDTEIQGSEANSYNWGIHCSNLNISDLTGIEDFISLTSLSCNDNQLTSLDLSNNTALTSLYCWQNQLTSLDLSNNTALTTLHCTQNQITSLDLSNNTALTTLSCWQNQLTSLDLSNTLLTYFPPSSLWIGGQINSLELHINNMTMLTEVDCNPENLTILNVVNNPSLTELNCSNNQLTSLDVSNNTALTHLECDGNQLTSLDVSGATALTHLSCSSNQLTSLDVSNNTALTEFGCAYNQLTSLDVSNNTALTEFGCAYNQLTSLDVSNNTALTWLNCGSNPLSFLDLSVNTALTYLYCYNNPLTSLDVSNNTALTQLDCSNNPLTSLDLRNGNNTNITYFNTTNNPNLTCIDVDDPTYSTVNWTIIDSWTAFSSNCATALGCTDSLACNYDSIATIDDLTCVYPSSNTSTATSCDSYTWAVDGQVYTTSGTYTDVSTNALGCDHTETLNLTLNYSTSTDTQVACDTYTWVDGVTYTTSNNTATYTYTNAAGCDSVVTLDLTINNSTSSTDTHLACDEFMWYCDGNTYTTSNNTATYTYTNAAGCDSVVTLDLTINNSTSSTDTHLACDEFMWYCDGNTYTTSNNTATYTYTNAAGCDSVVTLDLTINNSTSNSTTATACDSYTWAADGNTYTTSGTYTDISTNAGGCDHTETLELTINYSPNTTNILGVTNVEFLQIETYSVGQNLNSIFSWYLNNGGIIVNGINTNSVEVQWGSIDGSYDLYVVETTQDGCSDTALIVVNANCLPNASSSTITACDSYSWEGVTYTTSGTYTNTYINTAGCDSVHTLDLTIYSLVSSISQSGEVLSAVTTPIGLSADWYNIQTDNGETRIWLMEEDAPSFNPAFDCSYFIVVNDNGCIDTSETYSYGANAARIGSFVTSPNPTTGLINVKFDNSKNQFVMFELISNNGSKLDEFITIENNLDIDLSKYPSGSYYLYFNSEDAVQGCRLEELQKVSAKIILNK